MNMNAALTRLHGALEQNPVEEANTKLEAFFKWEKVLETYAAVWPGHFQRDQKKRLGMWETINSFFEKLSKYFPLASIDFGYGSDWEDWASSYIPFEPANWYDPECVEEWQSLTAKVLYEFGDEVESDWGSLEKITGIKIDRPAEWKMGDRLNWKRFNREVKKMPGGKGFLKAFALVRHDTGFALLDLTYEDMGECTDEWDPKTIRLVIAHAKRMDAFQKQAQRVIDQYDKEPKRLAEILSKVVAVWKRCLQKGKT